MTAPAFTTETFGAPSGQMEITVTAIDLNPAATNEAKRRALIAEAKAWRKIACEIACGRRAFMLSHQPPATGMEMEARWQRHHNATPISVCGCDTDAEWRGSRTLRALFLALECEDEARALKPARSRSRRGPK